MAFNDVGDFKQPIISILEDSDGLARVKEIYKQFVIRYPDVVNAPYWNDIIDKDLRWHDIINRCRYQILIPQ